MYSEATARVACVIRGVVQGVGFRPHVARIANARGLTGWCGNDDESVFLEAQGAPAALDGFLAAVRDDAPALAVIESLAVETRLPILGEEGFRIVESRRTPGARTLVPPDVGCCDACRREQRDPGDRRYRYPFITCTDCGPRLSIIRDLPYDRPLTTMAVFPMCAACRREYEDPSDRRFHAEPISCYDCGPTLRFVHGAGVAEGEAAWEGARAAVLSGAVVAVKGLGGYTLLCDARNEASVAALRARKRRPDKPFAVMAGSLAAAERIARLSLAARRELEGPARPIVVADRAAAYDLAPSVAPGLAGVGVMLASAAVHELLLRPADVWVATSGNVSGDPLFFRDDDALRGLAGIADAFLVNDREIALPVEDSVVLDGGREIVPLRRSRGYAPLPIRLGPADPEVAVLAVGGELKNTFALVRDGRAFLSAHVGDMGSLACQEAFERGLAQLAGLHRRDPRLVVADRHPDYATTRWAERYAEREDVPLVQIQHHHAHALSLLAEHEAVGESVVVATLDGTGYGDDGTIWGGEFLMLGVDPLEVARVGHLPPFRLPGADSATRNPWKSAVALLNDWGIDADGIASLDAASPGEVALVRSQLAADIGVAETTSAGRLFDAVASILGVRHRISYDAQAALELEATARACPHGGHEAMAPADPIALVARLVEGHRTGEPVACLARAFHEGFGAWVADTLERLVEEHGADGAGLSGGVAQNRVLAEIIGSRLTANRVPFLVHRRVPAGDGGLSLGQALAGSLLLAGGE